MPLLAPESALAPAAAAAAAPGAAAGRRPLRLALCALQGGSSRTGAWRPPATAAASHRQPQGGADLQGRKEESCLFRATDPRFSCSVQCRTGSSSTSAQQHAGERDRVCCMCSCQNLQTCSGSGPLATRARRPEVGSRAPVCRPHMWRRPPPICCCSAPGRPASRAAEVRVTVLSEMQSH
jgi:hypothetical protein